MVQASASRSLVKMFPGSKSTFYHNGKKFNYDRMIKYIYGDNTEDNLSSGHESDYEDVNFDEDELIEDDGVNQYRHIYHPEYQKVKIGPSKLKKSENSSGGNSKKDIGEGSRSQDAKYLLDFPPLPEPLIPPKPASQTLGILCFCNGYCQHFDSRTSSTNTDVEMNPSKKIRLAEDVEMEDEEEVEEPKVPTETPKKRKQLDDRHKWRVE